MDDEELPMYDEEFIALISTPEGRDKLLATINFTRGALRGYRYRITALETELAEYKEMTAIARQYQRKLDANWLRATYYGQVALRLEDEPLDH